MLQLPSICLMISLLCCCSRGKPGKGGPAVVIIPDEPREKMLCGCNAVSAVSQAVCMTGAQVAGRTLYKHVAALKYNGQVGHTSSPLHQLEFSILPDLKKLPSKVESFMQRNNYCPTIYPM